MTRNPIVACTLFLAPLAAVACTLSLFQPPMLSATPPVSPSAALDFPTPVPTSPQASTSTPTQEAATATAAPGISTTTPFCEDQAPRALLTQFKSAILDSDGALLASLVSPDHGMDAYLFRDGRVVNYDREHAAALFESSFAVNWGMAPGSGLETVGSFQELLVPDLLNVLTKDYLVACNEIRVGGATYTAAWPYAGINFYSLYFPGTPAVDGLDWHTWLLGMHSVGSRPYLYAIMQFKWEP